MVKRFGKQTSWQNSNGNCLWVCIIYQMRLSIVCSICFFFSSKRTKKSLPICVGRFFVRFDFFAFADGHCFTHLENAFLPVSGHCLKWVSRGTRACMCAMFPFYSEDHKTGRPHWSWAFLCGFVFFFCSLWSTAASWFCYQWNGIFDLLDVLGATRCSRDE